MKAKRTLKDYINAVAFVEDFRIKNCRTDNIGPAVQADNPEMDSIVRASHAAVIKLGYMAKVGEYYTRTNRWKNTDEVAKAVMDYVLENGRSSMAKYNAKKKETQHDGLTTYSIEELVQHLRNRGCEVTCRQIIDY